MKHIDLCVHTNSWLNIAHSGWKMTDSTFVRDDAAFEQESNSPAGINISHWPQRELDTKTDRLTDWLTYCQSQCVFDFFGVSLYVKSWIWEFIQSNDQLNFEFGRWEGISSAQEHSWSALQSLSWEPKCYFEDATEQEISVCPVEICEVWRVVSA